MSYISVIQLVLKAEGFYDGDIDGLRSTSTKEAIDKYSSLRLKNRTTEFNEVLWQSIISDLSNYFELKLN